MKTINFTNKYRKLKYLPNIALAILIFCFFKLLNKESVKKKIILIGGHLGEKYLDNSAILHQYIQENYDGYEVYWLTSNLNKDYVKDINGKVVKLGSFENYLLFLKSKACYFSHSLSTDIAPVIDKVVSNQWKPIRVHLSHGIEGLKKNIFFQDIENVDYYICSSNEEKRIKHEEWKLEEKKLVVTGVPRYDKLFKNKDSVPKKTVLYAPTWREWINSTDDDYFIKTEFFTTLKEIISSNELNEMLQKYDFNLEIVLHPFMHNKIHLFNKIAPLSNIRIINENEDVSNKIIESSILITDYSSVCWDFLYLNKPVIFYQFDQELYLQKRGAYLDLNKDLFGEVVLKQEQLLQQIENTFVTKLVNTEAYEKKRNKYFDYLDDKNCERVIQYTLTN